MIKKAFILTQFGKPHPWTEEYLKNIAFLGKFGYHWKIFTPNKYENVPDNVEIVDMDISGFNDLINDKLGVNPRNYLLDGIPVRPVSDLYVASGVIFEDYLRGFDYWGMANWDVVFGRLPLFIPDELLEVCDVFSDEISTLNGIFSLFKNEGKVNNLFKQIPDWEKKFCTYQLFGLDEYDMTEILNKNKDTIVFVTPQFSPLHSHDRLEQHFPEVKLEIKEDGSLWEMFKDVNPPKWIHARPLFKREIPYFHFIRTKEWPKCLK